MGDFLNTVSNALYSYVLVIVLIGVGLYFFVRTKAAPLRLFLESLRTVMEPPDQKGQLSSFRALMVSTASRVGVGNIAGVATAIALGGPGAVVWMWIIAIIGSSSALVESTLAQIFKRRGHNGSYGGPAYYIQQGLKRYWLGVVFAVALILTYMGGFNMVAAFTVADSFSIYSWFNQEWTPIIVGMLLAAATALAILWGTDQLSKVTGILVPLMAIAYLLIGLAVVVTHIEALPGVFVEIFKEAFDFGAIFGGFAGSAMLFGIKRGLYSNEAGVGSAPNAAASASVSHPVKQGLVQMLSVFIDTIIICSITAFSVLVTGVQTTSESNGAPLVQEAWATTFGFWAGPFVSFSLICFAFTTILGNFYYAEINFRFLLRNRPPKWTLVLLRVVAAMIVFIGALLEFSIAWNIADILMGLLALINLPVIVILGRYAYLALADYLRQRKAGQNPRFVAEKVGIDLPLDYWHAGSDAPGEGIKGED